MGLSEQDAALLARFRTTAEPYFPAIADEFYAVIRMHAGAFAVLQDEAQARRLHASLQVWLRELLSGTYDEAYVASRARVGTAHVRVGLDLRYMVAAMSRVRVSLQRIASDAGPTDGSGALTRMALARVCDLDLAIMLESFKDDLVGRLDRARAKEHECIRSQLDERKRLLEDVQQAAGVVLLGLDATGRLVIANPRAEQLAGYTREERWPILDIFELLFAERANAVRQALSRPPRGPRRDSRRRRGRARQARMVRWHAAAHRASQAYGSDGGRRGHRRDERARARAPSAAKRAPRRGRGAGGGAGARYSQPPQRSELALSVIERGLARTQDVPRR